MLNRRSAPLWFAVSSKFYPSFFRPSWDRYLIFAFYPPSLPPPSLSLTLSPSPLQNTTECIWKIVFAEIYTNWMICPVMIVFPGHGFHLITLLVLTDHGEGLPVAWMIASREDEVAVAQMLRGLQRTCADRELQFPTARYLMSDKAQALFLLFLFIIIAHLKTHP